MVCQAHQFKVCEMCGVTLDCATQAKYICVIFIASVEYSQCCLIQPAACGLADYSLVCRRLLVVPVNWYRGRCGIRTTPGRTIAVLLFNVGCSGTYGK